MRALSRNARESTTSMLSTSARFPLSKRICLIVIFLIEINLSCAEAAKQLLYYRNLSEDGMHL
nr:MAG TPA: hypothetical protein [Caudoviricetes sp.]